MVFKLNIRLEKDTIFVCENSYSQILLMNDSRYPWFIIVPKTNTLEIFNLEETWQLELNNQINLISIFLKSKHPKSILNIAKIGNIVQQLHVHVLARSENDFAWPNPVWGVGKIDKYDKKDSIILINEFNQYFDRYYETLN
tara:strand:- start:4918 stop:5340 length:423 start_codon:yes stop_codon:yes gene_type:complete